jgi:Mg-chelatase subunit ChlI
MLQRYIKNVMDHGVALESGSGVVLINGCFGVGKTTAAAALRKLLPGSVIYVIYDPAAVAPRP